MSMVTSLYPTVHQIINDENSLDKNIKTLPQILKENGYYTGGFINLIGDQGFNRGFDIYYYPDWRIHEAFIKEMIPEIFKWLDENKDNKFFAFLHFTDPHHPYTPKFPYSELFDKEYNGNLPKNISESLLREINMGNINLSNEDLQHIINMYDSEIVYTDEYLGRLFDKIKELNISNKTIIILTSDHGEEFNEHGVVGWHGHTLYNELLHVPLIIKGPNLESKKIDSKVGLIDIMPTIIDIVDINIEEELQGTSLLPISKLERINRNIISEIPLSSVSIQNENYKLIYKIENKEKLLFDIKKDPLEQNNIINLDNNQKIAELLEREITNWLEYNEKLSKKFKAGKVKLDENTIARLKSLGYIN